jgi:hypothetical protein
MDNDDNLRYETEDPSLRNSKDYEKVLKIIQDIWTCGVVERGYGYCYAMSDLIHNLLLIDGIESKLVECNLMCVNRDPPSLHLVGYDGQSDYKEGLDMMNNHVVCVTTNTEYPMLIDLSIGNLIPNIPFICERLNQTSPGKLGIYDFGNSIWTYDQRDSSGFKVARIHQQNMLDRIKLDLITDKKFKRINLILTGIIIVTALNFLRGGADYYQKYINRGNGFGPNQIELTP